MYLVLNPSRGVRRVKGHLIRRRGFSFAQIWRRHRRADLHYSHQTNETTSLSLLLLWKPPLYFFGLLPSKRYQSIAPLLRKTVRLVKQISTRIPSAKGAPWSSNMGNSVNALKTLSALLGEAGINEPVNSRSARNLPQCRYQAQSQRAQLHKGRHHARTDA